VRQIVARQIVVQPLLSIVLRKLVNPSPYTKACRWLQGLHLEQAESWSLSLLRIPTLLDSSKLSLEDMRAYPYTKAQIGYVSFNQCVKELITLIMIRLEYN
jgi:hypothetical protein